MLLLCRQHAFDGRCSRKLRCCGFVRRGRHPLPGRRHLLRHSLRRGFPCGYRLCDRLRLGCGPHAAKAGIDRGFHASLDLAHQRVVTEAAEQLCQRRFRTCGRRLGKSLRNRGCPHDCRRGHFLPRRGVRGRFFVRCLALPVGFDKGHAAARLHGLRRLILLLAPASEPALKILFPALAHDILPGLRPVFAAEIPALIVSILKHGGHSRRNLNAERRTARWAHNRKCLAARGRGNLILLDLVDAAGFLIKLAEILNIIRRQ